MGRNEWIREQNRPLMGDARLGVEGAGVIQPPVQPSTASVAPSPTSAFAADANTTAVPVKKPYYGTNMLTGIKRTEPVDNSNMTGENYLDVAQLTAAQLLILKAALKGTSFVAAKRLLTAAGGLGVTAAIPGVGDVLADVIIPPDAGVSDADEKQMVKDGVARAKLEASKKAKGDYRSPQEVLEALRAKGTGRKTKPSKPTSKK
jgi:hypothetical protein